MKSPKEALEVARANKAFNSEQKKLSLLLYGELRVGKEAKPNWK